MDETPKTFRPWNPVENATQMFSPTSALPEDDLVFFLLETIPEMDLSAFFKRYTETRGAPPFDVVMMCTLLTYSYSVGVFSSRKIAAACERNLAFKAIIGSDPPDFRTISDFRKQHIEAFEALFVEVLRLAGELGMVKLGNLALDGSKFNANASRHKAMSYGYMTKEVERLETEINELLQRADRVDCEEDAALGSRRGDELPEELKRRQDRLKAIGEAMQRLEQEAREKAEVERKRREAADAQRDAHGEKRRGRSPAPIPETPAEKAQTNFTDPDAKIMKRSNKGFDYSFNGQVVVDEEHQIIVGAEATADANDKQQAVPMVDVTIVTLNDAGIEWPSQDDGTPAKVPFSGDSGYFSEEALNELESRPIDPHIAVGRQKHNTSSNAAADANEPLPEQASAKQRMAHRLRTPSGRACYAKRKHIVEPVFGQMKHVRGFRQFLLRGLKKVQGEWKLVCLTHNLLKIWRYACALT